MNHGISNSPKARWILESRARDTKGEKRRSFLEMVKSAVSWFVYTEHFQYLQQRRGKGAKSGTVLRISPSGGSNGILETGISPLTRARMWLYFSSPQMALTSSLGGDFGSNTRLVFRTSGPAPVLGKALHSVPKTRITQSFHTVLGDPWAQ